MTATAPDGICDRCGQFLQTIAEDVEDYVEHSPDDCISALKTWLLAAETRGRVAGARAEREACAAIVEQMPALALRSAVAAMIRARGGK